MIHRYRTCDICKAPKESWLTLIRDPSAMKIKVRMFTSNWYYMPFSGYERIDVCPECAKVIAQIATQLREQRKKEGTT